MLNFKYKKQYKLKVKTHKFNNLIHGVFGIRVLESCRLTTKQLEAIRRVFVRVTKRESKFWIRVFINKRLTQKSKGSRMGKGVGNFDSFVIDVKAGQVIFECSFLDSKLLKIFLSGIKGKVPAKTEKIFRGIDFYNDFK
jgi:large subunit ribosomal protein L16